jgi:transcriptional regulator with XRE-family HTH domain
MRSPTHLSLDRTDSLDAAVGERIRFLRLKRGLSQNQLAAAIGASAHDIRMFEAGAIRVGAARLARIARALHVDIVAFFELASEPSDVLCAEPVGCSRFLH